MKSIFFLPVFLFYTLILCGESTLPDLKSLDELQKQFTADSGKVRMIALLSPT